MFYLSRFFRIVTLSILSLSTSAQITGHESKFRLLSFASIVPSSAGTLKPKPGGHRIPLEIDNNIILMRVSVNGSQPLRFIFDTGASFSAIDAPRAAQLGLKMQGQVSANATGGEIEASTIERVELSAQGAKVSDLTIASISFPKPPGFEFDGIVGCDFIKHFVIQIDYQNKVMDLFDPRSYSYRGKGAVIPLIFKPGDTPLALVRILLARPPALAANLEVDTGGDGTFIINSPFVAKHKLIEAVAKTNDATNRGAGGEQRVIFGRVREVHLGRIVLRNVPVALSQDTEGAGASTANDGLIGGEVFRRFKVVLDLSRKRMILERNSSFNDPYHFESDTD